MTRTTLYKGVYFAMFGGAGALALAVLVHFQFSPVAIAIVLVAMLVPGRILGFFWRDLLRGLRLLNARNYAESKICSEWFLVEVRAKPWIRYLIWLGSSSYSRNPEVLALNNLGAAEMNLGEPDSARAHLKQAIAIDPLCPLPFYNLGALSKAEGNLDEAERCFAQAARLGYTRGISDKIVSASQTRFANTDGR
jgi:tetratricopeptide (TPR) repeat protein